MPLGIRGFLADESLRTQFGVAPGAGEGKLCAALCLGELRFRSADRAGGALCGKAPAGDALLQIHRIEFGEQLSRPHRVALIHQHARDAAGKRRTECVTAARLDRADAEGACDQRPLFHPGQGDFGRRERTLIRRQPAEQQRGTDAEGGQRRLGAQAQVHACLRPR